MTSWQTIGPLFLIGAAITLGPLAGCMKETPSTNYPAPGATTDNEPPPAQAGELRDGQIIGMLTTIDSAEIEQARLARIRGNDPRVRQFAESMIEQHTASTQKASALAAQYGLSAAQSRPANELQETALTTRTTLERTPLRKFDMAYMQAQIQQHQEVLEILRDLITAADNEDLTVRLQANQEMVQEHLHRAQELLALLQPDEQLAPGATSQYDTQATSQSDKASK